VRYRGSARSRRGVEATHWVDIRDADEPGNTTVEPWVDVSPLEHEPTAANQPKTGTRGYRQTAAYQMVADLAGQLQGTCRCLDLKLRQRHTLAERGGGLGAEEDNVAAGTATSTGPVVASLSRLGAPSVSSRIAWPAWVGR
jgi:hypothetical protein